MRAKLAPARESPASLAKSRRARRECQPFPCSKLEIMFR